MASEEKEKKEKIEVTKVSDAEVQKHLKEHGYNIDIGAVSFEEQDLVQEMNQSADSSSDTSGSSSGGVQNAKTEFVDSGTRNITQMLDKNIIVSLPLKDKEKNKEKSKEEKGEKEQEK